MFYGFGKPFFGKPYGWPATVGGGFGGSIPNTTVITSPYPI